MITDYDAAVSLQPPWRDLEFCAHTDHAEVNMKTTVKMAASACTPKTVTNLFACKIHCLPPFVFFFLSFFLF